jgi:uncharacterized membrane protein
LAVGERAEFFAGVWILAITLARAQNMVRFVRFTDDQALIPVGLSHLVYPDVVALVPVWLPFRLFWLYATGIGHIAAGVVLIVSVPPRLAAVMEAAMMSSFVLLVLCISTAFPGAAWSTARSYRGVEHSRKHGVPQ